MSRTTLFWDRLAVLLLALVLVVLGLAGISWALGMWPHISEPLDLTSTHAWFTSGWWPWAMLVAGLVLVLVGLRWLLAHVGSSSVRRLRLSGSRSSDVLEVDASSLTSAAADALGEVGGVRAATGRLRRDRGALVADLVASVEPYASLAAVSSGADQVSASLATVLGRDDLTCRVAVKVAGRRSLPGARGHVSR